MLSMLKSGQLTRNNRTMKFHYFIKGPKPTDGYPLIFGFHGGGNCPANVNDSQYNNHKELYKKQLPNSCIWFTPRSIENASDMWWKDYLEDFLLEIVRSFVFNELVNINKVFITGYSAGGDGVYHMASRLADNLAGAAMMAGHPNQANFINLRNIKFSIQVGALDKAYNRANQGIKCSRMMAQLAQNYGGYENKCIILQNKPHWMNKQETQVFNWLFCAIRNPYPQTILFRQCSRRKKDYFYYLRIGESLNNRDNEDTLVLKEGNTFRIFSNRKLSVFVNSNMINPNHPISIIHNGQKTVQRIMTTNQQIIEKTILDRMDPYYVFEDELQSLPSRIIDVEAAICYQFRISLAEKNAEYEPGLSKKPEQTPSNFIKSVHPLMKRSSNLPQRFITGYKENEEKQKDNWGNTYSLDQWGNQLNQQWHQNAQNFSQQVQSPYVWNQQQRQGNKLDGQYEPMSQNQNSFHSHPPYLNNRNYQQNVEQVPYNPYNQYAPKQNRKKNSDCKII